MSMYAYYAGMLEDFDPSGLSCCGGKKKPSSSIMNTIDNALNRFLGQGSIFSCCGNAKVGDWYDKRTYGCCSGGAGGGSGVFHKTNQCCVNGVIKNRQARWKAESFPSPDACYGHYSNISTLTGIVVGSSLQAATQFAQSQAKKASGGFAKIIAKQIVTKGNAVGWIVTGYSALDYANARITCSELVCK